MQALAHKYSRQPLEDRPLDGTDIAQMPSGSGTLSGTRLGKRGKLGKVDGGLANAILLLCKHNKADQQSAGGS